MRVHGAGAGSLGEGGMVLGGVPSEGGGDDGIVVGAGGRAVAEGARGQTLLAVDSPIQRGVLGFEKFESEPRSRARARASISGGLDWAVVRKPRMGKPS